MDSTLTPAQAATIICPACHRRNRVDLARVAMAPQCGVCRSPLQLDRPVRATEDDLEDTLASATVPVLVDFYADWCGPCKMMAPAVDELAARNIGTALVAKLNTDQAPQTSGSFSIRGIPTVIVFKGGEEVARQSGALPIGGLESLLQRARTPSA